VVSVAKLVTSEQDWLVGPETTSFRWDNKAHCCILISSFDERAGVSSCGIEVDLRVPEHCSADIVFNCSLSSPFFEAMAAYRVQNAALTESGAFEEQETSMLDGSIESSPSLGSHMPPPPTSLEAGETSYRDASKIGENRRYNYAALPIADGISGYGGSGASFHEKEQDQPPMPLLQEIGFVITIVLAQFLSLGSLGQGLGPREIIAKDMNVTSPADQAWFSAAFSLTAGTFILVMGRLGDLYGHKKLLTSGYAVLGVCSIFAGFGAYVKRQEFFDVCRALQGIGVAMMIPNALALLGRAYPRGMKKNLIFALFGAMAPEGGVLGIILGNVFAELTWWYVSAASTSKHP
jgi:hypothetical protein